MPDLTTKDALLERMVSATEQLKTDIPAAFDLTVRKITATYNDSDYFNTAGTYAVGTTNAPFSALVVFSSNTGRSGNRMYFVNGYGAGGSSRTKYYMVPLDTGDGYYTPTVVDNTVTFAKTDPGYVRAEAYVLNEDPSAPVTFTFTPAE